MSHGGSGGGQERHEGRNEGRTDDVHFPDRAASAGPGEEGSSLPSTRISYRARSRARPRASCAAERSAITACTTCCRTAASWGTRGADFSWTQTRCSPYGEAIGPDHTPGSKSNTCLAKGLPKRDTIRFSEYARSCSPRGKGSDSSAAASEERAWDRSCARTASASLSR